MGGWVGGQRERKKKEKDSIHPPTHLPTYLGLRLLLEEGVQHPKPQLASLHFTWVGGWVGGRRTRIGGGGRRTKVGGGGGGGGRRREEEGVAVAEIEGSSEEGG